MKLGPQAEEPLSNQEAQKRQQNVGAEVMMATAVLWPRLEPVARMSK